MTRIAAAAGRLAGLIHPLISPSHRLIAFVCRYLIGGHIVQLGGVSKNVSYDYPPLQHKHFTGCLRNLLVDSQVLLQTGWHPVPLFTPTSFWFLLKYCWQELLPRF